jgi:hypothetical protein
MEAVKRAQMLRPRPAMASSDHIAVNLVIIGAIVLLIAFVLRFSRLAAAGLVVIAILGAIGVLWLSAVRHKRRLRELAFAQWLIHTKERAAIVSVQTIIDWSDPHWRKKFDAGVSSYEALDEWRRRSASAGIAIAKEGRRSTTHKPTI